MNLRVILSILFLIFYSNSCFSQQGCGMLTGPATICSNSSSTIVLNSGYSGNTYQLIKDGVTYIEAAKSPIQSSEQLRWTITQPGRYTLQIYGNHCYSGPVVVALDNSTPQNNLSITSSSNNASYCANEVVTLSVSGGNGTYSWSGPDGFSKSGSSVQVTLPPTTSSSARNVTYTVYSTATSTCNGSAPISTSKTFVVNPPVAVPPVPTGGRTSICRGQGALEDTYSSPAANPYDKYSYSIVSTPLDINNIDALTGRVTWHPNFTGTARITVTAKGCGTPLSSSRIVDVYPIPTKPDPSVSASPICKTESVEFRATSREYAPGASVEHRWYTSADKSGRQSDVSVATNGPYYQTYLTRTISSTTTYYVSIVVNGCESALNPVRVDFTPNISVSASGVSLCGNGEAVLTASAPPGSTYNWIAPTGAAVSTGTIPYFKTEYLTNTLSTSPQVFNYSVAINVPNSCPVTIATPVNVYYEYLAPSAIVTNICDNGKSTITPSGGPANNSFIWMYYDTDGTLLSSNSPTFVTPNLTADKTYYVAYQLTQPPGCISRRVPVTVKFYDSPSNLIAPSGTKKICSTCEQVITSSAAGVGTTYQWKDASGNISGQTNSSYTATNTGVYSVLATQNGCSTTSNTLSLTKNGIPVANAGADQTIDLTSPTHVIAGTASDADGTTPAVLWTQISGPEVTMSATNTLNLSLSGMTPGIYEFRLTATDELSESAHDEVIIKALPPNNYNWIKETTVLIKDQTTESQVSALSIGHKNISWSYFDGLGRPSQIVQVQSSPSSKDIVQPIFYDQFGRESTKFLPYVSNEGNGWYKVNPVGTNPTSYLASGHAKFYSSLDKEVAKDIAPYSQVIFDQSPLNRVLKQGAPGTSWQPDDLDYVHSTDKSIKFSYESNTEFEVLNWTYSIPSTDGFALVNATDQTGTSYYLPNELYKSKSKDEHNNEVIEYKDKEGKVILKKVQVNADVYAQTYYIYDDFGNLACVLPPEAVKGILSTPTSEYFGQNDEVKNAFLEKWAFRYSYDYRQRMIEKQVPGAGKVIMAYDKRDRLVVTQDAAQTIRKEWTYTKYDALNRPIINGIYVKDIDVKTMRDNIDAHSVYSEHPNTTTSDYTLNQSFPTDVDPSKILSVTYYDNYDFIGQGYFDSENLNYGFTPNELAKAEDKYPYSKGLVTGTKTKVLGKDKWLNSVSYYDSKNRVIQSISENYVGGQDIISNRYDFVGKILKNKQEHTGIKPLTIHQEFVYDHVGRLKEQWQQIGDDQNKKVLLAENKYNELGQLVDKGIGVKVSETGRVPLQSIDYRYNIRGWLTNINRSDLKTDNGEINDDTNDKFGMEMLYENIESLRPGL